MGFGLLLIGYIVSYVIKLGAIEYAAVPVLIGGIIMHFGLHELKKYSPVFIYAYIVDMIHVLFALFETVVLADTLFALGWGLSADGIEMTVSAVELLLEVVFNVSMLIAIYDISRRVDFIDIGKKAIRNIVFVGIFALFQIFVNLPFAFIENEKPFLMSLLLILSLVYALFNVGVLFKSYAFICPEGDEEMRRKKSRFEFINRINEKNDAREEKAEEEMQSYYRDKLRKREEKRRQKYGSKDIKHGGKWKKKKKR